MEAVEWVQDLVAGWPPIVVALAIVLLAALPILEVRASIPVGLAIYGTSALSVTAVAALSLLGNLLILPLLWWALPRLELWGRKWGPLNRLIEWVYARTRRKTSKKTERIEEASIMAIVALPLPGAGTWTAVITSHVFGMTRRQTFRAVLIGALVEVVIVTAVVVAGFAAWEWLAG